MTDMGARDDESVSSLRGVTGGNSYGMLGGYGPSGETQEKEINKANLDAYISRMGGINNAGI